MRTFLDIQQITISRARKPDKTGRYRWSVFWITSTTTVTQSFFSQKARRRAQDNFAEAPSADAVAGLGAAFCHPVRQGYLRVDGRGR